MKKIFSLLLAFSLIVFFGCKTLGQADNKKYEVIINLPNNTWQTSSFSNKQAQFIEKKGSQGKISIMAVQIDEKQIPDINKKSLNDIYAILKSKTDQKGFTKVKELPDKTILEQTWKGLEVTMEFKIANKKMENLIQTLYISKKGKSSFMVALNCPQKSNTETLKEFDMVLSKLIIKETK